MSVTYDNIKQIIPRYPQIHSQQLLDALSELNSLVGLNKIKQAVLGQLAYALMLLDNPDLNRNKYMLHTLITGPPGVGKSNLAQILGRIWAALGIVGHNIMSRKDFTTEQETIYHTYRNAEYISSIVEVLLSTTPKEILESPNLNTLLEHKFSEEEQLNKIQARLLRIELKATKMREQLAKIQTLVAEMSETTNIIDESEISEPTEEAANICINDRRMVDRLNDILEMCKDTIDSAKNVCDLLEGEKKPIKFKKVTRADLVGPYQGHTAEKTRNVLLEALGGVLFVDEAYQLMTTHEDNGDNFGAECLTTINEFMSENPDNIIIIFSGYEDTMEETIFRVQPGLKRRFVWQFNIEPYSCEELATIVVKQATDDNWKLAENVNISWICELMMSNSSCFSNYGGDTSRLIFYTVIEHACQRVINPDLEKGILTRDMFLVGLKQLKENSSKDQAPPIGMFI